VEISRAMKLQIFPDATPEISLVAINVVY